MKRALFIIFLFVYTCVEAQKAGQTLIDSVINNLPSYFDDTNKVKALAKIGETYLFMEPSKGISYVRQGLIISEKIGYQKGISRMDNLLGLLVGDTGNNTLSREYFNRSYEVNKTIGFSFGIISNLNNIGRSYQRESDFTSALDYFLRALKVAEEIKNNEQIALVGTNLSSSFNAQGDHAKAFEYAEMTLKYGRLSNSVNNIGKALFEMGIIKSEERDTVAARSYFEQAFKVYEKMGNKMSMAQVMVEKSILEYPDFKKAIVIMLQAKNILDSIGPSSISMIADLANLGDSYFQLAITQTGVRKKSELELGERYLKTGMNLCLETGSKEFQAIISKTLSKIKEAENNYPSALANFKAFYEINDSLFSQDKKNQLAALEIKDKIALKDKELAISKLEVANQRRTLLALVMGILLFGIIGVLLVRQNRIRKKSNSMLMVLNSRLDEANKVKAKFFGILSHDLRSPISNLINYLYILKNEPGQLSEDDKMTSQLQISQSAGDLLKTMEAMLLWSKEQMDNFKPDIKPIRVSILFDYIQNFFPSNGNSSIVLFNPDELELSADENYIKVIMQNLTSNALKALRNYSHGLIEWKAWRIGVNTVLSISDNGPGLSADQVKAFYSDDITINTNTGFGFRIIRDLAEAIQYTVSIESTAGSGTTVTLFSSLSLSSA